MTILRQVFLSTATFCAFTLSAALDESNPTHYWFEPANPTQNDAVTLYFDAAAHQGCLTNYSGDVYLYGGVTLGGNTLWQHAPDWNTLSHNDKWKMTRDSNNPNLYTLEMSPSIATWFGMSPGENATHVNLIFRTASDAKHYGNSDQYLPLKAVDPDDPVIPTVSELGAMQDWNDSGREVTFTGEKGTLVLTPYSPDIIKVFTLPENDTRTERRSISVCLNPAAEYSVTETEDAVEIRMTGGITASVARNTLLVSFISDDRTLLSEYTNLHNRSGNVSMTFAPTQDAAFYGGGYNGDVTNVANRRLEMNNTQKWGWEQGTPGSRCINIPFVMASSGYGILFDNHFRNASITPSPSGTTYTSSSPDPVAYYFIGGGTMEKVHQNYTLLTGRQKMPPYWALGYITSRYGYHSDSEATEVINNIKGMNLPLDGLVFDLFWEGEDESGMGNLDWYTREFPDAPGMMARFLEKGVHTIAITEPYFTSRCNNYQTLVSKGYLADADVNNMEWLKSPQVGLLDATNPEALKWMGNFYIARTEEGMSGWWLDLGEPESHDDDSHHAGGSVGQVHNEFGNLWVEGIYNILQDKFPHKRHLLMPRAGTAGMQRFSTFPWTGDILRSWGGLKAQIPALVNASMAGVGYLGSDCGGFAAPGDIYNPDLYLRWMQFSVFSPSMRTHSAYEPEPYNYSSRADEIRKFVNLRYRYLPYTYTLSWANTYKGEPMARPANFADSDPEFLAGCNDAYLWGKDIFVAPVVNSGSSRSITFPEGKWLDLNDFETPYRGHTSVTYNADGRLPYFGRYGSFIPRYAQETFTCTADARHDDIIVDFIYDLDNPESTGYLYDDDHEDPEPVENGNYTLTTFRSQLVDGTLEIYADRSGTTHTASPETQYITLVIHGYNPPEGSDTYGISYQPEAGAGAPRRAPQSDFRLPLYETPEALLNSAGSGAAKDQGHYYVRFATAPAQSFALAVGGSGVPSGLEEYVAPGHLTLGYAGGAIQYSAPEEYSDVTIIVHTPDGRQADRFSDLQADGTVAEVYPALPRGIYIIRLEARTPSGAVSTKTLKAVF